LRSGQSEHEDPERVTRASLTVTALMNGCALFVAASGLLGTALSLHASNMGFAVDVIGFVMAAYFLGFVSGTAICPRVIVAVGHIRAFSVFAACAATASIMHALLFGVLSWALLRFVTGVCLAGMYMVVESWLNEQAANETRGRVFAFYQIISLASLAIGQWILLVMSANLIAPFLISAMLFALGLVPTALARVTEPAPVESVQLNLRHLWTASPLGVLGAFTAAVANSVFFSLGPVFGASTGMNIQEIAAFMSLVILGGVALQWPIGHLSDRFDRRSMIFLVSLAAAALAGCAAWSAGTAASVFFISAFLYGGFTFSVYPLCVAHSNDHVSPQEFVKTASGLLLVYGAGATAGPIVAGLLMDPYGSRAFFAFLLATHAIMSAFILYRITARPAPGIEHQEPFVMLNRTSQSALAMIPTAGADDAAAAGASAAERD
jgi:MFS family permease